MSDSTFKVIHLAGAAADLSPQAGGDAVLHAADPAASTPAKVAHLVLTLDCGGLERLVCDLASESSREFDPVVCCLDSRGQLADSLERSGVPVHLVQRKRGLDPGLVLRLARWLRREGIQIVHTHGPDPMFYGGWAAALAGLPVRVHTQHDTMLESGTWREQLKFRLAAPAFHSIVAVSQRTHEILLHHARRHSGLTTVLNGIDTTRFSSMGAVGGTSREFVIGTAARLSPEKGLDRLVHAFAMLNKSHPNCRLLVAGDGPERALLQRLAKDLGLENVAFVGHQTRVEAFLRRLDVFALPSLTEGIPLALLEAMAMGLPVVATAVGGVPEVIVPEESGLLVPPDNPLEFHNALIRLVDSPELRARIGAGAERRARAVFCLSAMASRYHALYRQDVKHRFGAGLFRRVAAGVLPARLIAWRGSPSRPEVSLTIDDGPHPEYTPQLLQILKHAGVRATFFVVGEHIERHPDLLRAIVADGHEVGNHSYSHPDFAQLSWGAARRETARTRSVLEELAPGANGRLFRPPFGAVCTASTVAQWLVGNQVVLWNRDFKDYLAAETADVTARVSSTRFTPGDIILYHGLNRPAIEALPALIAGVRRAGLDFVPVSRLC